MKKTRLLAGDIGGTKVNLALCEIEGDQIVPQSMRRYSSSEFKSLSEILLIYFSESSVDLSTISAACFGVPGPVRQGRCQTINLPWILDEKELERTLNFTPIRLINDLFAMAYGISTVRLKNEIVPLHRGQELSATNANQALIAPGTGLGEALLFWDGERHLVSASEGGHCDFGPQNEEQIELLKWLWPRHPHVSWEHVASGPGIFRIYRFLRETGREVEPAEMSAALSSPEVDPSPVIANAALEGKSKICIRTMDQIR